MDIKWLAIALLVGAVLGSGITWYISRLDVGGLDKQLADSRKSVAELTKGLDDASNTNRQLEGITQDLKWRLDSGASIVGKIGDTVAGIQTTGQSTLDTVRNVIDALRKIQGRLKEYDSMVNRGRVAGSP